MLELQHHDMLLYWQRKSTSVSAAAAVGDALSASELPEDGQVIHSCTTQIVLHLLCFCGPLANNIYHGP